MLYSPRVAYYILCSFSLNLPERKLGGIPRKLAALNQTLKNNEKGRFCSGEQETRRMHQL
jgi:hypothetical protein